jgi:hypothetical protein
MYGACLTFFEGFDSDEELNKLHQVISDLRSQIETRNSLMTSNDATDSDPVEEEEEDSSNVLGEGENEMLSSKQKRRKGSTTPGNFIKQFPSNSSKIPQDYWKILLKALRQKSKTNRFMFPRVFVLFHTGHFSLLSRRF